MNEEFKKLNETRLSAIKQIDEEIKELEKRIELLKITKETMFERI